MALTRSIPRGPRFFLFGLVILGATNLVACAPSVTSNSKEIADQPPGKPTEVSASTTASEVKVEPEHVASECPMINGEFRRNGVGSVDTFTTTVTEGGVIVVSTTDVKPMIVDGKNHLMLSSSSMGHYKATCRNGAIRVEGRESSGGPADVAAQISKYSDDGDWVVTDLSGKAKPIILVNAVRPLVQAAHVVAECPVLNGRYIYQGELFEIATTTTSDSVSYTVHDPENTRTATQVLQADGKRQNGGFLGYGSAHVVACLNSALEIRFVKENKVDAVLSIKPAGSDLSMTMSLTTANGGRSDSRLYKKAVEPVKQPATSTTDGAPVTSPAPSSGGAASDAPSEVKNDRAGESDHDGDWFQAPSERK